MTLSLNSAPSASEGPMFVTVMVYVTGAPDT